MLNIFQPTYLSTPVENLFIEEFMVKAPGEFVKVYLYGLRFALFPMEGSQLTSEDFAKALQIFRQKNSPCCSYPQRIVLYKRTKNMRKPYEKM